MTPTLDILFITSAHPPFDPRIYHKMFLSVKKFKYSVKILLIDKKDLSNIDNDFLSIKSPRIKFSRLISNFLLVKKSILLKPKLVIFFDPDLLPFMLFHKLFSGSKVIYDNHEDYPNFIMENHRFPLFLRIIIRFFYVFFEKIGFLLFDQLTYADQFTPDYYKKIPDERITILHNYPIISNYEKREKIYDVIFPGSLDLCYKRILNIIDECEKIECLNLKILVIGRNVSIRIQDEINDYSKHLKRNSLIFLMDKTYDEVQNYIEMSKIGITPLAPIKKMENNIPTKMFEYLMHSIPQLASDLKPISYYLHQTQSGYCVPEKDFAKLYAQKIYEILRNYDSFLKFAISDKNTLNELWNWENEEEILKSLLENILGTKQRNNGFEPE